MRTLKYMFEEIFHAIFFSHVAHVALLFVYSCLLGKLIRPMGLNKHIMLQVTTQSQCENNVHTYVFSLLGGDLSITLKIFMLF